MEKYKKYEEFKRGYDSSSKVFPAIEKCRFFVTLDMRTSTQEIVKERERVKEREIARKIVGKKGETGETVRILFPALQKMKIGNLSQKT
jgi:hypothetical protein